MHPSIIGKDRPLKARRYLRTHKNADLRSDIKAQGKSVGRRVHGVVVANTPFAKSVAGSEHHGTRHVNPHQFPCPKPTAMSNGISAGQAKEHNSLFFFVLDFFFKKKYVTYMHWIRWKMADRK